MNFFSKTLTGDSVAESVRWWLGILIPVAFVAIVAATVPFTRIFEYDPDEGVYLMRAYLHAHGFELYKDVWMDQPPVFILILSNLFKIFGPSVPAARWLVLVFSGIFLWAVYRIISRTQNTFSAVWAVAMMIFSSLHIRSSVAVMGTIPSLSLAALSLYGLFLYGETGKRRYLVFSGGLFALAFLTRVFVIVFLPGILWEIFLIRRRAPADRKKKLGSAGATALWFLAFGAVFFYVCCVATSLDFSQLAQGFVRGQKLSFYPVSDLPGWLMDELDILFLLIGTFLLTGRQEKKFYAVLERVSR